MKKIATLLTIMIVNITVFSQTKDNLYTVRETGTQGVSYFDVNGTGTKDDPYQLITGATRLDEYGFDVSMPFIFRVSMGLIDGFSTIDKFAVNPEVSPATDPEDVIEQGGRIFYDSYGTAPIGYISSSSSLDVGIDVEIQGLDVNGNEVSQTATLNGQGNVILTTPLWRAYRMQNESSEGVDVQGVVYLHTDPTPTNGVPTTASIRLIIDGYHNQTLYGGITIPRGKVGFLVRGEIGVELEGNTNALAEYAHCHYESRRFGSVFKVKKAITCIVGGNAVYQDYRSFPDIIPSMTDIRIAVIEVSQTMGVWSTFDILLVDEGKFSDEFLQAIGQVGF